MAEEAERLATYIKHRTGDSLRSVISYGAGGEEVVFLRQDLEGQYSGSELERIARRAWEVHDDLSSFGAATFGFDQYYSTVHTFADIFVFQLLLEEDSGVLLSFERDVGRNLHRFVTECLEKADSAAVSDEPDS